MYTMCLKLSSSLKATWYYVSQFLFIYLFQIDPKLFIIYQQLFMKLDWNVY